MTTNIKVSKEELRSFKELQIIANLRSVKDKISFFKNKYRSDYESFELEVKSGKEDFEKWDDYIEWKAYESELQSLTDKLNVIKHATNFTITD